MIVKSIRYSGVCLLAVAWYIHGHVVRMLDGDTLDVLQSGNELILVRLAGIDAPEKSQHFGQRSQQELSSMVAQPNIMDLF